LPFFFIRYPYLRNAHAVNEVSSKEETGAPTPRNLNPNPEMSFRGDYEDVAKAGGT
jgi:hypothetical protein